jgi:hypothetical protein
MTSGSMTSGGMTSGGMTSGGMTSGGMTSGGMTSGGMTMDASVGTDAARPDAGGADGGITMSFFVTSTGSGVNGGNLGGLAGADAKCQMLAAGKGFGGKTWKAYLSIQGTNAKDRIGLGPWYNQKGTLIAANLNALHANNFEIPVANVLDESGAAVPLNQHDVLTGSKDDGTSEGSNCNGWVSSADGQGHVGHTDAAAAGSGTWNDAHDVGCAAAAITAANGAGRLYCFASNWRSVRNALPNVRFV